MSTWVMNLALNGLNNLNQLMHDWDDSSEADSSPKVKNQHASATLAWYLRMI